MGSHIAIFRGKEIRKTIHNDEWWFSVVDVCAALTDSVDVIRHQRILP
jgi:DNA-damage-inducible protein D